MSNNESRIRNIFDTEYLNHKRDATDSSIKRVSTEWINWILIGIGIYMKIAMFVMYPQLIIHFNSFKCNCGKLNDIIKNIQIYIILLYIIFTIYNFDYIIALPNILKSRSGIFKYLNDTYNNYDMNSGANAINIYAESLLLLDPIIYILEKNILAFYIIKAICLLLFIILHIIIIIKYIKYNSVIKSCKCTNISDTPATIFYLLNAIFFIITMLMPYMIPFLSDLLNKNDSI